jgi:hypothetical protein
MAASLSQPVMSATANTTAAAVKYRRSSLL